MATTSAFNKFSLMALPKAKPETTAGKKAIST
jgi:hypothetical protein